MSAPASVAEVLARHIRLEVECIDRLYLNVLSAAVAARAWDRGVLPISLRLSLSFFRPDGSDQQAVLGSSADIHSGETATAGRLQNATTKRAGRSAIPVAISRSGGRSLCRPSLE